jgi:predicted DNA-binding transcriptional regulator AlpA
MDVSCFLFKILWNGSREQPIRKPWRGKNVNQKFYRIREIIGDRKQGIAGIIPVSKASWYAGITEGRFPKPVKLGKKTAAWRSEDIDALVERLNDGRWNVNVADV